MRGFYLFLLIIIIGLTITFQINVFSATYSSSYTISTNEQKIEKNNSRLWYVHITSIPSSTYITKVEAQFQYTALNGSHSYVYARFQKGSDPGTSGPTLVYQGNGQVTSGSNKWISYVSFSNWNLNTSPNDKYYFRIGVGNNSPDALYVFVVKVQVTYEFKPSIPTLISPLSGTTTSNVLKWNTVSGASGYEIVVDGSISVPINSGNQSTYEFNLNFDVHTWKIRSKNSDGVYSDYSNVFTFTYAGLSPPSLVSPLSGNTTSNVFTWNTVSGASGYEIMVDGSITISINSGFQSTYFFNLDFANHNWKMRTKNNLGKPGGWSNLYSFTYVALNAPALVSPKSYNTTSSNTLTWSAVSGAYKYEICVDGMTPYIVINSGTQTTYQFTLPNGQHNWKMRTINNSDKPGSWSSLEYFTYSTKLNPPTLGSPTNNSNLTGPPFTFTWQSVTGAEAYQLKIADNIGFNPTVDLAEFINPGSKTTFQSEKNLTNDKTYYWQMRTYNSEGD